MSEIRRIEPVRGASGSLWWLDDEFEDGFEDDDTDDEQCPYCDYNPKYDGYTSHYHCGRCGEETGMMGHYRVIDDHENDVHWQGFTCDVNNERGAEWPEDDDEVF